jgi:hypothetical protein
VPCIDSSAVHFIQGSGLPGASTVGRNAFLAPGLDNLDLALSKRFRFSERMNLEFRADMFNALNTLNFGYRSPQDNVTTTPAGNFLDFNLTDTVARTMRMLLRFTF